MQTSVRTMQGGLMARKREVSPELWTDGKVLTLPWSAVGFYVGLISQADDAGRLEWDDRELAARICGAREDATLSDVRGWMVAVAEVGLVRVYEVAGRSYALHPQWGRHQHVNRPRPSILPNLDGVIDHASVSEGSVKSNGAAPPRARTASASASASGSGSVSASPPSPPTPGGGRRDRSDQTRAPQTVPAEARFSDAAAELRARYDRNLAAGRAITDDGGEQEGQA